MKDIHGTPFSYNLISLKFCTSQKASCFQLLFNSELVISFLGILLTYENRVPSSSSQEWDAQAADDAGADDAADGNGDDDADDDDDDDDDG